MWVLSGAPAKLIMLHKGNQSRPQLKIVGLESWVHNQRSETSSLRQDIVPQHSRISFYHGDLLSLSCSALSTCSGFDFRVKRNERLIPSTAPVHTKPKTIPSVSKPKCHSKGVEAIKKGKGKKKKKKKGEKI